MTGRTILMLALLTAPCLSAADTALRPLERILAADAEEAAPRVAATAATIQQPPLRIRVTSPKLVVLSSQIPGTVTSLAVKDGDEFKAGDTLMVLDDSLYRIQHERASAALARQDLVHGMFRELADRNSKGETEVAVAKADRDQAAAEVRHAEAMLNKHTLKAPFSGRVTEIYARERQYVGEGQPVLQVVDESDLGLEFIMNSSWMRHYPVGHVFTVKIHETGDTHEARIERYGGRVDPVSQSVKVYAVLTDSASLMEGMSGEAMLKQPDERKQ